MVIYRGRRFKEYRGMGSIGAMVQGSSDRYGAEPAETNWFRKAWRAGCPTAASSASSSTSWSAACGRAWVTSGPPTIEELRTKSRFVRVTNAGVVESHPHDILVTKESPNYATEADANS